MGGRAIFRVLAAAMVVGAGCAPAFDEPTHHSVRMTTDANPLTTPLERAGHARLTSHDELIEFVDRVASSSARITRRTLGESAEGREIPYLEVSAGRFGEDDSRVRVLIFAQQHGDEPSGKEAALVLLRDIAAGRHDDLLEWIDLLVVPSVNPDGGERHERQNAEGVDLNRSHLVLNGHEVRLLRALYHRWLPEVTLDVHEYRPWVGSWTDHGYVRLFDEQFGLPTNANVDPGVRRLARGAFLPFIDEWLVARGFTHHEYLVGSPDYIRYSTSDVNDGRQGFAILGSLGMILEGMNGRTPTENIERRVAGQLAAMGGLLHFVADHAREVQGVVSEARERLRRGDLDEFALVMDRARADAPLEIVATTAVPGANGDFTDGETIRAAIEAYHPTVVPVRRVALPDAYLVPASEDRLITLLREHGVAMEPLEEGREVPVEVLTLERFEAVPVKNETFDLPVVNAHDQEYRVGSGDMVVPTAQLHGRMVATALEPGSMHHLMRYEGFERLRELGRYPVMRVREWAPGNG